MLYRHPFFTAALPYGPAVPSRSTALAHGARVLVGKLLLIRWFRSESVYSRRYMWSLHTVVNAQRPRILERTPAPLSEHTGPKAVRNVGGGFIARYLA
jgi:hypothetical protein